MALVTFLTCFNATACGESPKPSGTSTTTSEETTQNTTISTKTVTTEQKPISKNNPYSNPTFPLVNGEKKPTYTADPYVIRDDDGMYYMYCTQTDVYTPAMRFNRGPIFKSIDLVNWVYAGDVFQNYVPDWGTKGAGVWAPTVIKVGNTWNFYYSFSTGGDENPGIGVATAPTPYGPFTHHGKLFKSKEIGVTNSIDPHVLYDDDKLYMVFGSFGGFITLIELTEDGLGLKGGLEYQKENKVTLGGFEPFNVDNYEASFIFKRNGKYHLLLSTGTCCSGASSTYRVVVATADKITGPYVDSKGRDMFKPNRGDVVVAPSVKGAMGTGHCCLIEDDLGDYWMIYHGYDTQSSFKDSRALYLDKIIFDETDLPHVENYKASNEVELPGPYIKTLEEK